MARGNFRLHASNAAFDRLGLSPVGVDAPIELLRAIERAAQYPEESQEFSCQLGEGPAARDLRGRSEEHTSELQSLMLISYAGFCSITKTITSTDSVTRTYTKHSNVS